jgi:hypothetical protein
MLNKLGEDFVYDHIPLHLAIFCGEYMRQKKGAGSWTIKKDAVFGTKKSIVKGKGNKDYEIDVVDTSIIARVDKIPVFITPSGIHIEFATCILKNLAEYGKVRLNQVLQFEMLELRFDIDNSL